MLLVEPCGACRRHIRRSVDACPFCGVAHDAKPIVYRSIPRTRLALAGGAMLLAAACGSPAGESSDTGEGTGGGEVVDGSGGGDVEQSCAGVCGSHHDPVCDENGENCVAPPYGAPPIDDPIV